MCQINTDPMRSNRGYLDVVVPPSIIDSKTSPDQVVKEGAAVNLTCGARGSPTPKIMWKREDNKMIHYKVRMGLKRKGGGTKCEWQGFMLWFQDGGSRVPSVDGNLLEIPRVSRIHIGAYFCIASNNIPPSVSKRIELKVQCECQIFSRTRHTSKNPVL